MPRQERIPDAALGSAPGLEIRQGAGRPAASEGGVSAQSVAHSEALSMLSEKGLDDIPIVQGSGEEKRYFDKRAREITKKDAMAMADGLGYYQNLANPSTGRFRHHGTYRSEAWVRNALERSRVGSSSDVGNPGDLVDLDGLEPVLEDVGIPETKPKKVPLLIPLVLLLAITMTFWPRASQESLLSTQQSWSSLGNDEPSKDHVEILQLPNGDQTSRDRQATRGHASRPDVRSVPLNAAMASLLNVDQMVSDELLLLEMLQLPNDDRTPRDKQKLQAAAEIDRILASRQASDILGPGPLSRQQREFRRIALLLHPDKGLVSAGDERAHVALRLAFAARSRVLARR